MDILRNELLNWAERGAYFKARNTTLGTGIAAAITTAFSATAALLAMRSSSAEKVVIPHYLRLINTVAGATSTSSRMAIAVDTAARYSSGGSDLSSLIKNSDSGSSAASVVDQLFFGAVVASAEVAARYLANMQLKTQAAPCWIVGDEVLINFLPNGGAGGPGPLSGAAANLIVKDVGPLVLRGANHSLLVHMWNPANATTPPSWELEFAWFERDRLRTS